MKNMLPILAGAMLVVLSGCIADSNSHHGNDDNHSTGPVINVPTPPPPPPVTEQGVADKVKGGVAEQLTKLKQDVSNQITASSNTTQDQMTGTFNVAVSKLAEKMTGVEANLKDLLHVEADVRNTANVDIQNRLNVALKAVAQLKAEFKADLKLAANVQAVATAVASLNTRLDHVSAQVGIGNRIEQLEQHLQAGRDINQLPMNTVWLMLIGCACVFGLLLAVVLVMGRAAREREAERVAQEKANVERWQQVALQAIQQLEPAKAREIKLPGGFR